MPSIGGAFDPPDSRIRCTKAAVHWLCAADTRPEQSDGRRLCLLHARRERPHRRRATEQRYEPAPPHSITSSASASSLGGISRPSPFAVLRLMTRSNFVGCTTGSSLGFSPFRIRPI